MLDKRLRSPSSPSATSDFVLPFAKQQKKETKNENFRSFDGDNDNGPDEPWRGRHWWHFVVRLAEVDERRENRKKVGVSSRNGFDVDTGYSSLSQSGWRACLLWRRIRSYSSVETSPDGRAFLGRILGFGVGGLLEDGDEQGALVLEMDRGSARQPTRGRGLRVGGDGTVGTWPDDGRQLSRAKWHWRVDGASRTHVPLRLKTRAHVAWRGSTRGGVPRRTWRGGRRATAARHARARLGQGQGTQETWADGQTGRKNQKGRGPVIRNVIFVFLLESIMSIGI